MSSDSPETRPRLYHERVELQRRRHAGDPIRFDFDMRTRFKLAEWLMRKLIPSESEQQLAFEKLLLAFGRPRLVLGAKLIGMSEAAQLKYLVTTDISTEQLCSILEAGAAAALELGGAPPVPARIDEFNALLGDEFLGYRIRWTGEGYQVVRIDSALLRRELVEPAFEITSDPIFAAANRDYAAAWEHYSRGLLGDAITNAGKALESAEKILLRQLDPETKVDLSAAKLAEKILDAGVLPTRLQAFRQQVRTLLAQGPTTIRNLPGNAHGSAEPQAPEEHLARLVLHLIGALIVFLVDVSNASIYP